MVFCQGIQKIIADFTKKILNFAISHNDAPGSSKLDSEFFYCP